MKVLIFFAFVLLSIFVNAQSITFNHPREGETITGTAYGSDERKIPVLITYGQTLTPYPPALSVGNIVKLYADKLYDSRETEIPSGISLPPGHYTFRIELWERFLGSNVLYRTAADTVSFNVKHTLFVKNNFGFGNIQKDGICSSSGSSALKFIGETLSLGALDQNYDGYQRIWNMNGTNSSKWLRQQLNSAPIAIPGATSRNYSYFVVDVDNQCSIIADLKRVVNVSFSNNLPGSTNPGIIKINNTDYSSPKSIQAIEEDHILYQAISPQIFNYVQYNFSQWNDGHTDISRAINPNINYNCVANFTGKAFFPESIRNLTYDLSRNDRIILHWNEHPNSNVTKYAIWRKVQDNGVLLSPQQIAVVNRGTLSVYDIMFKSDMNGVDMIWYDVRPYFAPDDTWGAENWGQGIKATQINFDKEKVEDVDDITEYFTGNYPNPFNPSTTITYQLPKDGNVILKVYNSIGKEIATLVNENKNRGRYTVEFDAGQLSSGIYFYQIRVDNDYNAIRKLLLVK